MSLRFPTKVQINDKTVYIDGEEFPYYLDESAPWIADMGRIGDSPGAPHYLVLTLPIILLSDECTVYDERTGQ